MLQQYWNAAVHIFIHAQHCVVKDVRTAECQNFWTAVMYACFGLAALILIPTAISLIKLRAAYHRSNNGVGARSTGTDDTSDEATRFETPEVLDIPHEEYAAMIRKYIKREPGQHHVLQ